MGPRTPAFDHAAHAQRHSAVASQRGRPGFSSRKRQSRTIAGGAGILPANARARPRTSARSTNGCAISGGHRGMRATSERSARHRTGLAPAFACRRAAARAPSSSKARQLVGTRRAETALERQTTCPASAAPVLGAAGTSAVRGAASWQAATTSQAARHPCPGTGSRP